jgi:chemotaxis protein MotB
LNKQNVFSPENRRIAIVILNKDAEARIRGDGLISSDADLSNATVSSPKEAAAAVAPVAPAGGH